jgi:hypothetical protein
MATKLTKPVTRVVSVKDANNVEGEISVTISEKGVQFIKGRRKLDVIPWEEIGKLTTLPLNAPARYAGNHLGWLVELSKDKDAETDTPTTEPAQ